MTSLSRTIVLALTAAFVSMPALARGDKAAGQAKAKQVCAACHGDNGDKPLTPDYPKLAGQYQDYLVHSLKDYKSGVRKNAIMNAQAQTLSTKDIEDVSAWFASQTPTVQTKR